MFVLWLGDFILFCVDIGVHPAGWVYWRQGAAVYSHIPSGFITFWIDCQKIEWKLLST